LLAKIRQFCWQDSEAVFVQANQLWDQGNFVKATLFYRWAFCLSDTSEQFAASFFKASRHIGEHLSALEFLQQRFEQFGHKSAGPACSLYRALEMQDRDHEGLEILAKGYALRPFDAALIEFYLDKLLLNSDQTVFDQVMKAQGHRLAPTDRLRLQASAAQRHGQVELAGFSKAVLDIHPEQWTSWVISGLSFKSKGQLKEAIATMNEAIKHFPLLPLVHFELAEMHYLDQNADQAIECLQETLRLTPGCCCQTFVRHFRRAGQF
jgi:tetratricopeptide (TPR) repeat protein